MTRVYVHGIGAVSPAGWGCDAMRAALASGEPAPLQDLKRPGWDRPLRARTVPDPKPAPAFLSHPRLRRAAPAAQHAVAAALEALESNKTSAHAQPAPSPGASAPPPGAPAPSPCQLPPPGAAMPPPGAAMPPPGAGRLAIIVCVLTGLVTYTRRFYEEAVRDPATASPVIFPETVFNAPASHLAAFLGAGGVNYTLVGDDGAFLQGLALAAQWLADGEADGCLVVGAEEMDWLVGDALRLFSRGAAPGNGAGAIYLRRESDGAMAELAAVTDSFSLSQPRELAARKMRAQLPAWAPDEWLCLGGRNQARHDAAENAAWSDWRGPRLAPKAILGEGFAASAAWQCVAACDAIHRKAAKAANVSVVGVTQQAIGARFCAA